MNTIEKPEIIQVLRHAHDEIIRLRRKIEALEPRAHAYDTIAQIAAISRHDVKVGYGEDPTWRIKKMVDDLVAERMAQKDQADEHD